MMMSATGRRRGASGNPRRGNIGAALRPAALAAVSAALAAVPAGLGVEPAARPAAV